MVHRRAAEFAEKIINFHLPLRGRQMKNNPSRLKQDKKAIRYKFLGNIVTNSDGILSEGLSRFAFRRPCPVECEAYSSGVSEKQKKQKLCVLCGSAVI
jgi:hypothetical protein